MTIKELIVELRKYPNNRTDVEYANMEIDDTCAIGRVEIEYNKDVVNGSKYKVILR